MLTMDEGRCRDVINEIIKDLAGRKGLGDAWEEVDDDIKEDIIDEWVEIILDNL